MPTAPDPDHHTNNGDAKPTRRRFSAEYKLRILDEADRCSLHGELGYEAGTPTPNWTAASGETTRSSSLSTWSDYLPT